MPNCESLSILFVTRPEQSACRELPKVKTRYTFTLHAQESGSMGNELDLEFLQKSGPYFHKIQPSCCNQNHS